MDLAVDRIMWGKTQNAGQICLAPDYVFVPEDKAEEFISRARAKIAGWYGTLRDNDQYCSIINQRHFARLNGYVEEARSRGVRVEQLGAAGEDFTRQSSRRTPPTIIVEPGEDLGIMQDEVFGPLLSLKTYRNLGEVVNFINARPRPLALYYFGKDKDSIRLLTERTTSGGMTVNDIAMHAAVESLPLGGVGNSGMGAYHGRDGFLRFSHAKAVLQQKGISLARLFNPPYRKRHIAMLDKAIGKTMV
jgi:coniferyl-aldehyde dehydrogenase